MRTVIREYEEQQTVKKIKRFCDLCGKELTETLACSRIKCSICGKDLCNSCVGHEEETYGDYRLGYCKRCWELGEPYRVRIEILERQIQKLNNEWAIVCKKDRGD